MEGLVEDVLRWLFSVERDQTQADYALCGPSK